MNEAYYVGYSTVHKLVKALANQVVASNYTADVIVAIGSGGFIPARILKTFIDLPIYAVGISYYDSQKRHEGRPKKIQWIEEAQKLLKGKRLLLIDEVDDTRMTLNYCITELLKSKPLEIVVLVLHNKLKRKRLNFLIRLPAILLPRRLKMFG